jgi:predicted TPR repeat methyltransferase
MDAKERAQALHYRQQVEALFDDYAPDFEKSLAALGYDVPNEILSELRGTADAVSLTCAVDLGCGTGLAGVAIKPYCKGTLLGCDLSGGMLELAREKAIYDRLDEMDAVAFLHRALEPASVDLIVAADVTVYMRALDGLMAGAARCLAPGGRLAFSTEMCSLAEAGGPGGPGWIERPSERIAHCEEYTRALVQAAGLEMAGMREVTVRMGGDSVNGPTGEIRGHLCVVFKGEHAPASTGNPFAPLQPLATHLSETLFRHQHRRHLLLRRTRRRPVVRLVAA